MSFVEDAKAKAEKFVGGLKEKTGDATDNEELRDSGRADQTDGDVREGANNVKEKAEDAVNKVKGAFQKD